MTGNEAICRRNNIKEKRQVEVAAEEAPEADKEVVDKAEGKNYFNDDTPT